MRKGCGSWCPPCYNGGYTVMEAANGSAALTIYEKNSHKIDPGPTDVVMPQMNGFELGDKWRKKTRICSPLYVGLSRRAINNAPGDPQKAFLNKPFTPDILLAKVREVLDGRRDSSGRIRELTGVQLTSARICYSAAIWDP